MVNVEVLTSPTTLPVSVDELKLWLRLNDSAEDALLAELLGAAVDQFEADTRRPVLSTTYRQTLAKWPTRIVTSNECGHSIGLILGRGGVTSITAVKSIDPVDNSESDLTGWRAELSLTPAKILLDSVPSVPLPLMGYGRSVGYVTFVAGWPDAAAVPHRVKVAIKLLAAHWYKNREAYGEGKLEDLPNGWRSVVGMYQLGLDGTWDQTP